MCYITDSEITYVSVKWGPLLWELKMPNSLKHSWDQAVFMAKTNTTVRTNFVREIVVWLLLSRLPPKVDGSKTIASTDWSSKSDRCLLGWVQSFRLLTMMQRSLMDDRTLHYLHLRRVMITNIYHSCGGLLEFWANRRELQIANFGVKIHQIVWMILKVKERVPHRKDGSLKLDILACVFHEGLGPKGYPTFVEERGLTSRSVHSPRARRRPAGSGREEIIQLIFYFFFICNGSGVPNRFLHCVGSLERSIRPTGTGSTRNWLLTRDSSDLFLKLIRFKTKASRAFSHR